MLPFAAAGQISLGDGLVIWLIVGLALFPTHKSCVPVAQIYALSILKVNQNVAKTYVKCATEYRNGPVNLSLVIELKIQPVETKRC